MNTIRPNTNWQALVTDALAGGPIEMDRLLRAARPLVANTVARALRGAERDDAVQDTLLAIYRRLGTLRQPGAFPGWAVLIARRIAWHHAAVRARQLPTDEQVLVRALACRTSGDDVEEVVDRMAACSVLPAAVARLSGAQQAVVACLLGNDDASYRLVARALGRPIGSLGPTRRRALTRLRADRDVAALV